MQESRLLTEFSNAFDGLQINHWKDVYLGQKSWAELGTKTLRFGSYEFKIFRTDYDDNNPAEIFINKIK